MCRFVAWIGAPIFLQDVVCAPAHSLVRQALHAERARTATNGDGFGVGWYGERDEPATYREVMPAWSDDNLHSLCETVRSGLFFAHVRAATGTAISRNNSHPFRFGRYLFMHNGQIGGYPKVRRALEARLPDALYAARKGSTDSELMFLLAMAKVARGAQPQAAIHAVFDETVAAMERAGVGEPLRFAAALSDGESLWAFRFASDSDPPTLFVRDTPRGTIVASEPFDDEETQWIAVAPGDTLRLERALHGPTPLDAGSLGAALHWSGGSRDPLAVA